MKLKIVMGIFLIIWAVGTYFAYTEVLKNKYKDNYYYDVNAYSIHHQGIDFSYAQRYKSKEKGIFRVNNEEFLNLVNEIGVDNLNISFLNEEFTKDKKSFTTTIWLKTSKEIFEKHGLEEYGFEINNYRDSGLLWIRNVTFVVLSNTTTDDFIALENNLSLRIEHKTTWHKIKRVLMSPVYGVVVGVQLVGISLLLLYLKITGEKLSIGW